MSENIMGWLFIIFTICGLLGVFIECYYIIPRKVEKEMKENPIDFLFPKWWLMMSEKRFNCVLAKDYHIINNNVDNMTYFLQDGNDVVLVINLLNSLSDKVDEQQAKIQKQEKIIKALEDDHKRQENEIKLLRQEYSKIPPKIREVWKDWLLWYWKNATTAENYSSKNTMPTNTAANIADTNQPLKANETTSTKGTVSGRTAIQGSRT